MARLVVPNDRQAYAYSGLEKCHSYGVTAKLRDPSPQAGRSSWSCKVILRERSCRSAGVKNAINSPNTPPTCRILDRSLRVYVSACACVCVCVCVCVCSRNYRVGNDPRSLARLDQPLILPELSELGLDVWEPGFAAWGGMLKAHYHADLDAAKATVKL